MQRRNASSPSFTVAQATAIHGNRAESELLHEVE